jgi:hypothetical protein
LPDCCRSRLPFHLGVRLQSRSSHLTCPSDFDRPFGSRQVVHQTHVSNLSVGHVPYPAGYGFPLPFGCWPSLVGPSFPAEEFRPSCVGPTGLKAGPQRGFHVPHGGDATGVDAIYTPGPRCPHGTSFRGHAGWPIIAASAIFRRRPSLTEPQRWFTCVHPSGLPLARQSPYGSGLPWTLPLAHKQSVTGLLFGVGTSMDTNSGQGSPPDHSHRATACRTSGKGEALLPLPPLRTVLATFTAHGSSRPLPSLLPDCCRSRLPFHLGVRLLSRGSHLTCPSDFDRPFGSRQVVHQAHVSNLSVGQTPYPPGYGFPLPFGWRPSLLGPSFPAAEFRPSCVGPTGRPPDHNGVSTFRSEEIRPGWMPSILRGRGVRT